MGRVLRGPSILTEEVSSGSSNLERVAVGLIISGRTLAGRIPMVGSLILVLVLVTVLVILILVLRVACPVPLSLSTSLLGETLISLRNFVRKGFSF